MRANALEGWSDCLRLEVKPFGIDVVVVEPGGVKTSWGIIAAEALRKVSGHGAYAEGAIKAADSMAQMYATGKNLTDQTVLAEEIVKAATTAKPKTRYVKGFMAKPMILLRQWLGDRAFDKIITSAS